MTNQAAERLRRLQPNLTKALNLWREFEDSGWETHANTPELLDAVNIMAHVCALEHAADDDEALTDEAVLEIVGGVFSVRLTQNGYSVKLPRHIRVETKGDLRMLLKALGVSGE